MDEKACFIYDSSIQSFYLVITQLYISLELRTCASFDVLFVKLGFIFPLTVKTRHASIPGSPVHITPVSKVCEFI